MRIRKAIRSSGRFRHTAWREVRARESSLKGLPQTFSGFRTIDRVHCRSDALHSPQIIFEKQTLDVFDNPHASELVDRLPADAEYFVFGVVTEYCVKCAAKGLLARNRKVAIVKDAIEALDAAAGRAVLVELRSLGARLITTDEAVASVTPKPQPASI